MMLDVGCGNAKRQGAVGVDISRDSDADVILDLGRSGLPFADGVFSHVHMSHIIEHLHDAVSVMEEVWRVCLPGGVVEGATPHFSNSASYSDPTHCHHFSYRAFEFFARQPPRRHGWFRRVLGRLYCAAPFAHKPRVATRFEQIEVRLTFNPLFRRLGIQWAANVYPELYEAFFAFILPARNIEFRLRALK